MLKLNKNTEFYKLLRKKALVCFDECYIRIINKKEQLILFNYLKKKNFKFICFVKKNKKFKNKKITSICKNKIIFFSFFYILDLIFNLKKITTHLYDIFKNPDIRLIYNNSKIKKRPLIISILRCLLIIIKDYGYFKKNAKNYEALYVVCYYNTCNLAPILAFKLMNKPVYEIQHGYMGSDHFCYNKKIILSKNIFVPNKFILWRGENIPYLNRNSIIHNSYPEVKKFKKKKTRKIVIGFTMSVEQISNSVINFINKNSENYIWLIKQHPTDNINILERDDIKKISHNKNIIFKDKALPIHKFFKNVNINFTEDSSSVYEAYICGIYSITNNYRLYKRYRIKLGKFLLYTTNKNLNFVIKKINVEH